MTTTSFARADPVSARRKAVIASSTSVELRGLGDLLVGVGVEPADADTA